MFLVRSVCGAQHFNTYTGGIIYDRYASHLMFLGIEACRSISESLLMIGFVVKRQAFLLPECTNIFF